MANTPKTLISLDNLKAYNTQVQGQITAVDTLAKDGIKFVEYTASTGKIDFYKVNPKEGNPIYSITLPENLATRLSQAETDIDTIEGILGTGFSSSATVAAAIAAAKKAGDDAQADVDALEEVVGEAPAAAVGTAGEAGYVPAKAGSGILKDIADLKAASSTGVDGKITTAIEALDADITSTSTANAKGDKIDVEVKEVDGKITEVIVTGNYDATYDAIGAAAAVQGETTETVASVDAKVEALGTASASDVATVEIGTENEVTTALPTVAQVKKYVTDSVADLEGATHFIGVKTELPTEGMKSGDICIVGAKEYIYDGTEWQELGDESIYVTKTTTIAGVDLQNDITATELKSALGIITLEGLHAKNGDTYKTVEAQIADEAKDAIYIAAKAESAEGAGDGQEEVTIAQAIKANADAIAALDIAGDIDTKIAALDADKTSATVEEGKGIQVQVTEVDGKIDTVVVTGSYDNKYDELGAAGAVKDELDYTVPTDAAMFAALGITVE